MNNDEVDDDVDEDDDGRFFSSSFPSLPYTIRSLSSPSSLSLSLYSRKQSHHYRHLVCTTYNNCKRKRKRSELVEFITVASFSWSVLDIHTFLSSFHCIQQRIIQKRYIHNIHNTFVTIRMRIIVATHSLFKSAVGVATTATRAAAATTTTTAARTIPFSARLSGSIVATTEKSRYISSSSQIPTITTTVKLSAAIVPSSTNRLYLCTD